MSSEVVYRPNSSSSPCLNCEDRHTGCHSECDRYKNYSGKIRAFNEYMFRNNKYEFDYNEVVGKRFKRKISR